MSTVVDEIFTVFRQKGGRAYLGESVSMSDHMLQTAHAAERDGASPALVVAALLHDFGHLVHGMADDSADRGLDTAHEEVGARWLSQAFGPALTEPIRLHVDAKRYLCATDPSYIDLLSPASIHSLELQGGAFSQHSAELFAATPYATDAVRVRRWDDFAKVVGSSTPGLEHYRPLLETCLSSPAFEHAGDRR